MSLFQNIYTCFRTTKHYFDVHFDLHCQLDLVLHHLHHFSSSQQYEVCLEERVSVMFFEYVMSNPFLNTRKKKRQCWSYSRLVRMKNTEYRVNIVMAVFHG